MSAPVEFKDMATWSSNGTASSAQPQDALAEVKELLREIRDLQKAHFERYQEFTSKLLAAEKTREHVVGPFQLAQLRYQEEARQAAFTRQLISWAVWGAIVVLCLGTMFLHQFLFDF